MKFLILGCGSFAGQSLFSSFLENEEDVYGINRSSPLDKYHWPWISKYENQLSKRWFQYSLTKSLEEMILKIKEINPDVIIDFMGQGMVAQSWNEPNLWYTTNLANKSKLLNALIDLKKLKKYIRISTPEVYGSNSSYLKEDAKFNPSTPYAISHAAIDFHLRCLQNQYNFPFLIGRFANFYGIGQQLYRIIPRVFLSCKTKKTFILDGKGESKRSFIHTNDFVSAIYKLILFNGIGEEFNFSSNEEVSIASLVENICAIAKVDKKSIVINGPERPGKDKFYRLDITKSKNLLNWSPSTSLNVGLESIEKWISTNIDQLSKKSWHYEHKD